MSLRDSGTHWRALAKEVLTIADKVGDPENKREPIAIAENFELLADRADERAAISGPAKL